MDCGALHLMILFEPARRSILIKSHDISIHVSMGPIGMLPRLEENHHEENCHGAWRWYRQSPLVRRTNAVHGRQQL